MKADNKTNKILINFRIPMQLKKDIDGKAKSENLNNTEFIVKALNNEVYKDINIHNAELGTLQEILRIEKNIERKIDVFSNIFIYFLKYFFAIHTKELEDKNVHNLNDLFDKGEVRKNTFIKNFRKENKNVVSILETVLADYITEESD